jgi:hypothetical protein
MIVTFSVGTHTLSEDIDISRNANAYVGSVPGQWGNGEQLFPFLTTIVNLESSDYGMRSICGFTRLTDLTVFLRYEMRSAVTDAGFFQLHRLTALTHLELQDCAISNSSPLLGLTGLTELTLKCSGLAFVCSGPTRLRNSLTRASRFAIGLLSVLAGGFDLSFVLCCLHARLCAL